jgi:hypothetical protein
MRPPDPAAEDESLWLARAREASDRGPLGLHTHWTAPDHARPTGGDPAALVREQVAWIRERGLDASFFCGGGWYIDEHVAEALAELGLADCTATAFRPRYLAAGELRLEGREPCYVELSSGARLLELPTTHSVGMLARGLVRPLNEPLVHAYFHDTDLVDARRRQALRFGLAVLGVRRAQADLQQLQRDFRPAKTMSFAKSRG